MLISKFFLVRCPIKTQQSQSCPSHQTSAAFSALFAEWTANPDVDLSSVAQGRGILHFPGSRRHRGDAQMCLFTTSECRGFISMKSASSLPVLQAPPKQLCCFILCFLNNIEEADKEVILCFAVSVHHFPFLLWHWLMYYARNRKCVWKEQQHPTQTTQFSHSLAWKATHRILNHITGVFALTHHLSLQEKILFFFLCVLPPSIDPVLTAL